MTITRKFYRFLSLDVWGNLPSHWQRSISGYYSRLYDKSFSKIFIKPYARLNYNDPHYLDLFKPASGANDYQSFQDFFIRVYKQPPKIDSEYIWPCEGLLCDYGLVDKLPAINIKGDRRHIPTIFGKFGGEIPGDYYFSNVFLHNNNYHRIHSPVTAQIEDIEHIQGDLVMLRPWLYKNEPSLPAMRNERVNVVLQDHHSRKWYISIVGGPAVGTIVMNPRFAIGDRIEIGQELGTFLLGSTCCIAAPVPTEQSRPGDSVFMASPY